MTEQVLRAATMARAVASDPQFAFPRRPRLVAGLVQVATDTGLIVEGGPARQLYQGTSARTVLPRLMALLDGSRDLDGLTTALGAGRDTVWPALSLLYTTGLLEEADDTEPGMAASSVAYLARSLDTTRVNRSGAAAYRRLSNATVAIVTDPAHAGLADALAQLLRGDHVGTVTVPRIPTDVTRDTTLLILLGSSPAAEAAGLQAREAGMPILPAERRGHTLRLGPVLDAGHTACISCLMHQRHALPDAAGDGRPSSATTELAAELVAREALVLVSRVGTGCASNSLVSTDLGTWRQRVHAIAPRPLCPVCMEPSGLEDDGRMPLAWAYAHLVGFAPRESINPKDHQVHYKSGNLALQQSHRRWPASPATALPETVDLDRPPAGIRDLAAIGTLLRLCLGLRNGPSSAADRVDRWCATGGNLGSTTGYVVAREVPGLRPGVYGYQRGPDDLARLTWADPGTPLAGIRDDEPAVLVITGAMDVVASKYGPFAWQIVHLDTGAALAQMQLVARRLGLVTCPHPFWDDQELADLLAADPDREPVTAVVTLRARHHDPTTGAAR